MEIGTTNISAMIGPYVVPLATATEKFGIPYFVTSPLEHHQYRPYNMISIAPDPMDIVFIATEVAKRYKWDTVAVIYDSAEGRDIKNVCDRSFFLFRYSFLKEGSCWSTSNLPVHILLLSIGQLHHPCSFPARLPYCHPLDIPNCQFL